MYKSQALAYQDLKKWWSQSCSAFVSLLLGTGYGLLWKLFRRGGGGGLSNLTCVLDKVLCQRKSERKETHHPWMVRAFLVGKYSVNCNPGRTQQWKLDRKWEKTRVIPQTWEWCEASVDSQANSFGWERELEERWGTKYLSKADSSNSFKI